MRLSQFLDTQPIDVIQWNEPEAGTLAYRYPMLDMEIQTGAKLTVRDGEMAVLVEQGRIADAFGPGVYALNAAELPLLAGLKKWGNGFGSRFRSDVYFFSTRGEMGQRWGTATPIALHDQESGTICLRGYGVYSYRIADARSFFTQVSGTQESYFVYDLDDRLRTMIAVCMAETFTAGWVSYLDLATDMAALSDGVVEQVRPAFAALGLELMEFAIQSISLQDELQGDAEGATNCGCCGASMRIDRGIFKCDYCHTVVVGGDGAGISEEFAGEACPGCAIPLLQATIGGASLLYCTRCDGMLVAMEEFEALIAASRALPGGPIAVQSASCTDVNPAIACPRCRRAMEAQFHGGNVAIDNCEGCGLNWLDHGELARIAHGAGCECGVESNASGAYFNASRAGSAAGLNVGA